MALVKSVPGAATATVVFHPDFTIRSERSPLTAWYATLRKEVSEAMTTLIRLTTELLNAPERVKSKIQRDLDVAKDVIKTRHYYLMRGSTQRSDQSNVDYRGL